MKWFRFYAEALHDVKVQSLPAPLFKAWVNLLCLAASHEQGMIPKSALAVGFQLRIPTAKADKILRALIDAGLLEDNETGDLRPHNWNGRQFESDARLTEGRRKHDESRRKTQGRWGARAAVAPPLRRDVGAADSDTDTEEKRRDTEETTTPSSPPWQGDSGGGGILYTDEPVRYSRL